MKSRLDAAFVEGLANVVARSFGARLGLLEQAVAERLGLGATDQRALDLARGAERLTAGDLAELTGLTTGAVTGVLDRLERAGFIRRDKDPDDKRQVIVRVVAGKEREVDEVVAPFKKAFAELCAKYTEEQLELVKEFLDETIALVDRETERLRGGHEVRASASDAELYQPLGAIKRGVLELARGASNVSLSSASGQHLYDARFSGPAPRIDVDRGRVVVQYARSAFQLFDFSKRKLDLALSARVPWLVEIRGGASSLKASLEHVAMLGVEIHGGANDVELKLGRPEGTVPIRIHGGANKVLIERPHGVAARLHIASGASHLSIDAMRFDAVGGATRWESPDYGAAKNRYDIEISGGASQFTLGLRVKR